ncbi:uncharacterized protein (DUF2249 family) [Salirhabdus euzebyi]|uniref:Uncharacterized protein (DUF2249 family) n=1 Tax=Salirhabdus euzebyi TaxID=394506 RepID=A0A841Q402_9BACI|nr:DUF2249 domain-containing protein [Salirhabdus euzebyi]MBB6453092.1 uncharacterized protein (DUF2249 family) [Salirhabdus euzebyi]
MEEKYTFAVEIYAPDIEPRIRHPKIFEAFDELSAGEALQLVNDHDPRPLHYQFMMEREGTFVWEYIEQGPALWKVAISKK